MISRKDWIKMLLIVPIAFLQNLSTLLDGKGNAEVGHLLATSLLGESNIDGEKIYILVVEGLLYLVIFHLLYGNYISENFRYSSTYFFSRVISRKRWFYRMCRCLMIITMLYTFFFLGTQLILCDISTKKEINQETIFLAIRLWIMLILILSSTTVLINLLSLKLGNSTGFLAVYLILLILIYIALKSPKFELVEKYPVILAFNPASALSFNFEQNMIIQSVIIIYYALINVIVFFAGANYVNRFDIAIMDAESR